jgi:tetratricopeptide (TPR) repeat protein
MSLLILSAAFLASQVQPPAPAQPPVDQEGQRVIVTGDRPEGAPREAVEQPYSETERVPLGSRIARRERQRPFENVASHTGLAGMLPSKELDFDGTGGPAPRFRNRRVLECRAVHEQVSQEVACILFRAKQETDARNYAAARDALTPLLARHGLTAWERYYGGYYVYQLADAEQDDAGRERALHIMLASGRMAEADRGQAVRALSRIALRSPDDATAIARFERLVQAQAEADALADLAALYARTGRLDQARTRMAEAVALKRQAGETPPSGWTAFLARTN